MRGSLRRRQAGKALYSGTRSYAWKYARCYAFLRKSTSFYDGVYRRKQSRPYDFKNSLLKPFVEGSCGFLWRSGNGS
jgi:hypothetical protein